jgi:chemotaxis protein CheC
MSTPVATPDVSVAPAGGADDLLAPSAAQREAMRCVANIGAGHAAAALSQMTGGPVLLTVPSVRVERLAAAAALVAAVDGREAQVAAVRVGMAGDLVGRALLVLPKRTAMRVAERLLRRPTGSAVALGAAERSAVMEAGNIVCGAFLHAMADAMGASIVPSPPSIAVETGDAALAPDVLQAGGDRPVVVVSTLLSMQHVTERLGAHFLLAPDVPALRAILRAARGA